MLIDILPFWNERPSAPPTILHLYKTWTWLGAEEVVQTVTQAWGCETDPWQGCKSLSRGVCSEYQAGDSENHRYPGSSQPNSWAPGSGESPWLKIIKTKEREGHTTEEGHLRLTSSLYLHAMNTRILTHINMCTHMCTTNTCKKEGELFIKLYPTISLLI